MKTAFVLAGGGSLGAVQAGMLLVLAEAGIEPEVVVGTSVGAINAAWVAGNPGADGARELVSIWRKVKRRDVFPSRVVTGLLGLAGKRDSLVRADGLRRLISTHLDFEKLEDARLPLKVVTADITTGREVVLSSGDAVEAVCASAAIPGVFPPVVVGGRPLVDGGVLDNAPISCAVSAGATRVYVIPSGYACALSEPPRGALAIALQAIALMIHQRLISDARKYQDLIDLRVVPPLCPLEVSPIDFSHTDELVERAVRSTRRWLESGGDDRPDQAAVLALHEHGR